MSFMENANRGRRHELASSITACPSCHGALDEEATGLRCRSCTAVYTVKDGLPVLIPADVGFLQPDTRWVPERAVRSHPRLWAALDRVRRRIAAEPVYKTQAARAV